MYSVDSSEFVGVIFLVDLDDGFVEACLVVSDSDVDCLVVSDSVVVC